MKTIKPKTCRNDNCGKTFIPRSSLQIACSMGCAIKISNERKWKADKKAMKEQLKTHKDYLKILQVVFNTFIRERDLKHNPICISCDCDMKNRKGDASHYFSVGSSSNIRFNEDNAHLACVPCNQHKHGNIAEYSIRLPKRIGIERFKALQDARTVSNKLSIPEIKNLILHYKQQIKKLKE